MANQSAAEIMLAGVERDKDTYRTEHQYNLIRREAEKMAQEPREDSIHILNAAVRNELKELKEVTNIPLTTTLICRISGLPICKIPALPWQALPLEIPYAQLTLPQVTKIRSWILKQKYNKREPSVESQIFLFYALLAKCPVEIRQKSYLPYTHKNWEEIFKRGLTRLYNFVLWYSEQGTRVKSRFPTWRITEDAEFYFSPAIEDHNNQFNFFSILTQWERVKDNLEFRGRGESDDFDSDDSRASREDLESALYETATAHEKRMGKRGTLHNFFDRRRKNYKENIEAAVEELHSLYGIAAENRNRFLRIVQNPMVLHTEKLKEYIQIFTERGAGRESFSHYHREFLDWLKQNLSVKMVMQKKLEVLEEKELEEGRFTMNIVEAVGQPRRSDFKTLSAWLVALKVFKEKEGKSNE